MLRTFKLLIIVALNLLPNCNTGVFSESNSFNCCISVGSSLLVFCVSCNYFFIEFRTSGAG